MKQTVYLAGPISGLLAGSAGKWRRDVRLALEGHGYQCLDPMRGHTVRPTAEPLRADGGNWAYGPKAVFKRDKHEVERADFLLVNLLGAARVSIFTMMEMAWAEAWNKFILTVMSGGPDDLHEHLAVREASSLVLPTLDEAVHYLTAIHNQ